MSVHTRGDEGGNPYSGAPLLRSACLRLSTNISYTLQKWVKCHFAITCISQYNEHKPITEGESS